MKPTIPCEPVLNAKQCAGLLGDILRPGGRPVSTNTVYRWLKKDLPCRRFQGALIFYESEVRRFIDAQRKGKFI